MPHPKLLVLAAAIAAGQVAFPAFAGDTRVAQSAPAGSQTERNKATARRVYEEAINQGRFDVPYTPGFVGHGGRGTFSHAEGMAEARGFREAFPDLVMTIDHVVAEGDLVSVRWTARGTNTGEGNGIPATGRRVQVSGMTLFRFEGGAIAEEWTSGDSLGLMRQLGLLPPPGTAPPGTAEAPAQ
jgi:predicted ester cyclase